ncbi:MAG: glycosyltransferase family 4 protein [Candidatus Thorarchaeota archaeon]
MYNLLYLPTRYFPSISGAEFYFQRMAEILTFKYNYKVNIFTSNAIDFRALRDPKGKIIKEDDKYFDEVNSLKINRFPINYNISEEEILQKLKSISTFNSLNISSECIRKIARNGPYVGNLLDFFLHKKRFSYDLVHSTFYPYFNLILSLIIGKCNNTPTICTPFFHFSNPRYLDPTMTDILKKFDAIIACTHLEKIKLVKDYHIQEEKIRVIPMGVDYNILKSKRFNNYHFKQSFFMRHERNYKLVLFCGYKNYEKGAITVLKSIPLILEKKKKVYFVFIGPSTKAFNIELSKIQKHKHARVVNFSPDNLTGYYDKKKLTAFKEADLLLMPSRSDAFGIVYLEAWAAGIPVIGARIGATPEVIRENVDGLLVEFDNPEETAQKVIKLLKNKKLRSNLGLAGQLKVSRNFTWDIVAEKTHHLYHNLIEPHK